MKLTAVMSIRRKWLDKIVAGLKGYEFRRARASSDLKRILFYCPEDKAIVASADVVQVFREIHPATLYNSLEPRKIGMTPGEFFDYFSGARYACAIELENVKRMSPTPLAKYGVKHAPQSYCFVKDGQS